MRDQARHQAGAPASIGGQWKAESTPAAAATLLTEFNSRPIESRIYDDEYRLDGLKPPAHEVLEGIVRESTGRPVQSAEVEAYLTHARKEGFYENLEWIARPGMASSDNDERLHQLTAMQATLDEVDFVSSPVERAQTGAGYMGGHEVKGSKYEANFWEPLPEVNKKVRNDLKAAQDSGYLPTAAKFSVRKQAGSDGINVTVSGLPREMVWDNQDPHLRPARLTRYGAELDRRVSEIAGAYGYSDTNASVDYFASHREAMVRYDLTDDGC